ncbi:hypothetical protein [Sphingomicrobium aestuariivivum]|uniref:hypothetical protein n=1 Tax=Sphingomicrobium aestuariivivum TaxID=1582356 RepID=UPI001FD65E2A|nr:hypothetical protein [Sphingomicrobium aestuariivivum]MCJ8190889.1 hypothetical protein [Sphingomicrobium aestuariivivum]
MHADQKQFDKSAETAIADRRMQVRAYNYWYSLLDGRDFPSIDDLKPADLQNFALNSVLMDFTNGAEDPTLPYVGQAIRTQCGVGESIEKLSEVPRDSMLGAVAEHYERLMECRAPVGFESGSAEEVGDGPVYRGILMPFSSDDRTIDFVYAVVNWKTAEQRAADAEARAKAEEEAAAELEDLDAPAPLPQGDGPQAEPEVQDAEAGAEVEAETETGDAAADVGDILAAAEEVLAEAEEAVEQPAEEEVVLEAVAEAEGEPEVIASPEEEVEDEEVFVPEPLPEVDMSAPGVVAFAPVEPDDEDRETDSVDYAALAAVDLPDEMDDEGEEEAETDNDAYAELTGRFEKMDRPDPLSDMGEEGLDETLELGAVEESDPAAEADEPLELDAVVEEDHVPAAALADEEEALELDVPVVEPVEEEEPVALDPLAEAAAEEPAFVEEAAPVVADEPAFEPEEAVEARQLEAVEEVEDVTDVADEPVAEELVAVEDEPAPLPEALEDTVITDDIVDDEPLELAAEAEEVEDVAEEEVASEPSQLETWLEAAREAAALSNDADSRSRSALYRALGQAYDFSLVAEAEPDHYAALLEAAELTVQARAPMTPIVKLVFGVEYDKTRLTEFAAALSYGHRQDLGQGEFEAFVSEAEGGLKGLVAAERALKRGEEVPEPKPNSRLDAACRRLRERDAIDLARLGANEEFALVLVRRDENGGHAPVARVIDHKLVERAILKSGR